MRTSFSAIETYLQCPQRYKFQEINRVRVPKGHEAIFGTLIHGVLKFMFERNPLFPTINEVIDRYRERWPSREELTAKFRHDFLHRSWTEAEEKIYFEEGIRMLTRFYEKNAPWNYVIADLESRFEVVLTDDITGETHILAGIIDRIDKLPDGKYEIIDYKTSRKMPPQDKVNHNLQLSLYSLGLQKRWPHLLPHDIVLSLYFLKHGEKLTAVQAENATEETKTHILKTIREIQNRIKDGKEFEPVPGPLCDWCAYKPICPAWKHLYRNSNQEVTKSKDEIDAILKEYFTIKKEQKKDDIRLEELQNQIREYMEKEGLTRVFGEEGTISQKSVQRFSYDWEKVKAILSPLGKWEEVLKLDEIKLKKILKEVPENIRELIEATRAVSKEYIVLSTKSEKLKKNPGNLESAPQIKRSAV